MAETFNASLNPNDWPESTTERSIYLDRLLHKVICVGCDTTPRKVWMGMLTGESNYGLRCDCWPEKPKPVQQIYHVDERRWNMVKHEIARRPNDLAQITVQDVKEHLASEATDPELELFVRFCVSQELNPFAREAHLVKFKDEPAYIQVDYKVLFRRAHRDPDYIRYKSGVSILVDDNLERRTGSLVLPGEKLVGGWCKVWMRGHDEPIEEEVSFAEFNTGRSVWAKKPGFMIEKVAITTDFRRAVRGIEDLMGAAVAMRVEAAEVGPPITDSDTDGDPTAGGLYEAPARPTQPTEPTGDTASFHGSPTQPVSEPQGTPGLQDREYAPGDGPSDAELGQGDPESDGGPALFPPEQASASPATPRKPRKFANAGAFRKALADQFGLVKLVDIEAALEAASLSPFAQVGNFADAYEALYVHRQAEPIETTEA